MKWPKDNQTALIKFFGDPGSGEVASQLVSVVPPFRFTYGGKPFKKFVVHRKAASSFASALKKIWDYYGHDQKLLDNLKISRTSGTYAPRKVRGSTTKWSNHAYGSAVDINAEENMLGKVKNTIPMPVVAAFKSEGWAWGGDYKNRKDNMHFEAVDRGEKSRTFAQWLEHYGCPPLGTHTIRDAAEKPIPAFLKKTVAAPEETAVQGNEVVFNIQRRLKDLNYSPGELDGKWGGKTAGAIAAFINDRELEIVPPKSSETFADVVDELDEAISEAETDTGPDGKKWTRPIAAERAEATADELAPKLPEVKAAMTAERVGFWGSITAAVSTTVAGVSKFFEDAVEWLNPIKEFIGDLPWPIWVGGALAVAGALYYISRKSGEAKDEATKAYQEGARS